MMPDLFIIATAFMLGLLGSLHCAGMCGGIVSLLHNNQKVSANNHFASEILLSMTFNGGRILSYAVAGAVASVLGISLIGLVGLETSRTFMQMMAGLIMLALGLYLAGWWNGLAIVERLGQKLWHHIQPGLGKLLPVTNYPRALAAGMMWGWLPCGLVYSALVLVIASGNPVTGAVAMAAFGLGTLPMMSAIGIASQRFMLFGNPIARQSAGILIMLFGILSFTGLLIPMGMSGHEMQH